jgi:hypothetical protein
MTRWLVLLLICLTACSGGVSRERYQKVIDDNVTLTQVIEFDRDVQVALAVYLNHQLTPRDRRFLCSVLHTKPAKQYFGCHPK